MKNNRWDTGLINDDDEDEWLPQDSKQSWVSAFFDFILTAVMVTVFVVVFLVGAITIVKAILEWTK